MGVLMFEVLCIVVLLVCLWLLCSFVLLAVAKCNADKAFKRLVGKLQGEYSMIKTSMDNIQPSQELVGETKELIAKASEFSLEKDSNERIIGYANAIFANSAKLGISISKDFNKTKESYNASAKNLRYYADVFPTSLIARLKLIKTMDYIN